MLWLFIHIFGILQCSKYLHSEISDINTIKSNYWNTTINNEKKKWKKKLNDFAIIRLLFLSGTLNFSGIKNPKESFRTLFVAQKCKKIITAVPKNVNCFPTFRHACYIVRLPAIPSQWNKLLTYIHTLVYIAIHVMFRTEL